MRHYGVVLCTLLALISSVVAQAGMGSSAGIGEDSVSGLVSPANITSGERIDLEGHLELLEDPDGTLEFEQVQSLDYAGKFESLNGKSSNFGFSTSAWWARFTLANPSDQSREVIVRQDYPLIDWFDAWYVDESGLQQHLATGDLRAFDTRPVEHRLFLIPMQLPPNSERTVYVRFESQGAINIGLFAHAPVDFLNMAVREYLALGIYYGGFLVLLIYNLFMYLMVRERAFSYYLIYLASYGLYMSIHNGISFQFLAPAYPFLVNKALLVLLGISLFGGTLFSRTILNSSEISPRGDAVAYFLQMASLISAVAAPFVSYHFMIIVLSVLTVAICVHMVILGLLALARGTGTARYYMIAFSALLLSVYVYMAKTFGLLPHNFFTQNAFQIGSLIEMVLLSLAVASRLNELKAESFTDALTQLYNRRYFNDQMAIEFARALQNQQDLALIVVDIDNFKQFNDTHGHAKGDAALKTVAGILKANVRKPNTVCRYGGEEFVIILPEINEREAVFVAERIRSAVERETAQGFGLTASFGVASLHVERFESAEALFVAADHALYRAKESGRNQVTSYHQKDDTPVRDQRSLPDSA
ncbi:sensor domain-containing diguanylate cyclase [Marinobacter zhejiangensis]|nr:diguanylate cyclase [Marinobacter zhejiangensis]